MKPIVLILSASFWATIVRRYRYCIHAALQMKGSVPAPKNSEGKTTNVYVRPHELQIERYSNGSPSMPALVSRINPAGSVAKISLQAEGGSDIQVDLPFEQFLELDLKLGEQVYVSPKRVRVFSPDDYVI